MRATLKVLPLIILLLSGGRLHAQQVGLRIGAGPAYADQLGAAGLVAVNYASGAVVLRGEARAVTSGRSGDWENSARVIAAGVAAGVRRERAAGLRPYAMVTVAAGLDPREGDGVRSFGAVAGIETTSRVGWFVEARAERWVQHGIRYFDLPRNVAGLTAGLAIR